MAKAMISCGIALALALGSTACIGAEAGDGVERFDQRFVRDYPIYRLLLKKGCYGSGGTEVRKWETAKKKGKLFKDDKRASDLQTILTDHAASDYADDAALLQARALYLYQGDVAGAIKGLYAVIRKYPKGTWIAEDRVFLEHAALPNKSKDGKVLDGWFGKLLPLEEVDRMEPGPKRKYYEELWRGAGAVEAYFKRLKAEPNTTADEAKYWIAWIIIKSGQTDRLPEAEKVLGEVISARQAAKRVAADLAVAKSERFGDTIKAYMARTEMKAHILLLETMDAQGRQADAKTSAKVFASLYPERVARTDWFQRKGWVD